MDASHDDIPQRLSDASLCRKAEQTNRRCGLFIRGPIPLRWMAEAANLPGKVAVVAIVLWFRHGLARGGAFTVPGSLLRQFGVSRQAASRAYKQLADADLIRLERQPGRLPRISLLLGSTDGPSRIDPNEPQIGSEQRARIDRRGTGLTTRRHTDAS